MKKLGNKWGDKIDWSNPRLLCIAGDFTKYDLHAVQQINRNIELLRYRRFDPDLLLLDLVNATSAQNGKPIENDKSLKREGKKENPHKTFTEFLEQSDEDLKDRYEELRAFIEALGDDVQTKVLKFYVAFKRIKNFACVNIAPQKKEITVWVKLYPRAFDLDKEKGFLRDVTNIGHFGTGDLEISIKNDNDLERAKNLILQSFEDN